MKIDSFLAAKKKVVDAALDKYLPQNSDARIIIEAMRYSLFAGGKRLRPILVLITYETMGGKNINKIMTAACAVEMVHTYSLIHDDLPAMDNDDLRRGKPTCHKKYGEAIAILAGDALFAEAFEILQKTEVESEALLKVNRVFSKAVGIDGIVGGQVMDIVSNLESKDKELLDYIHTHKTGVFISACIVIGAILANANEHQVEALRNAGDKLGLAFQIVDDILDLQSTNDVIGKSTGKDARMGKLTYPAIYGLQTSKDKTVQLLNDVKSIFDNELTNLDTSKLAQIAEFIVNRAY